MSSPLFQITFHLSQFLKQIFFFIFTRFSKIHFLKVNYLDRLRSEYLKTKGEIRLLGQNTGLDRIFFRFRQIFKQMSEEFDFRTQIISIGIF